MKAIAQRLILTRIRNSKKSLLLLGPRQVGKSTLCRALKPDQIINLADESDFFTYSKDPGKLRRELSDLSSKVILIDEVQRVPALLNVIQAIHDDAIGKKRGHRFLLTGSSARKLKQGGANLLPGRIILEHLDPLSVLELATPQLSKFNLSRALQVGMLPGIFLDENEGAQTLETYTATYLREEIRAEALAKDLGAYARFLDIAALLSGQWLNYSKVSSDTEISKETIRRYFSILEDTLMIFRLPAFQPKLKTSRRVAQKDKFLFFDVGVRNAILGTHSHPLTPDQKGASFEQWFILQAIYAARAYKTNWRLTAYRTEAGAEVDLVIEREKDIIGVEIKASKNISNSDTRGLCSLEEVIGKHKPFQKRIAFLGLKSQRLKDGTRVVPYLDLIREIFSDL